MAVGTNGTAPALSWFQRNSWAISPSLQIIFLITALAYWRATIDGVLADHTRRIESLEKSDRDGVSIPAKLDALITEQAKQEKRDEASSVRERVAAERLVRVEAAVASLVDQQRQVIQELRELRAERRGSTLPCRAGDPPAFRPN